MDIVLNEESCVSAVDGPRAVPGSLHAKNEASHQPLLNGQIALAYQEHATHDPMQGEAHWPTGPGLRPLRWADSI